MVLIKTLKNIKIFKDCKGSLKIFEDLYQHLQSSTKIISKSSRVLKDTSKDLVTISPLR